MPPQVSRKCWHPSIATKDNTLLSKSLHSTAEAFSTKAKTLTNDKQADYKQFKLPQSTKYLKEQLSINNNNYIFAKNFEGSTVGGGGVGGGGEGEPQEGQGEATAEGDVAGPTVLKQGQGHVDCGRDRRMSTNGAGSGEMTGSVPTTTEARQWNVGVPGQHLPSAGQRLPSLPAPPPPPAAGSTPSLPGRATVQAHEEGPMVPVCREAVYHPHAPDPLPREISQGLYPYSTSVTTLGSPHIQLPPSFYLQASGPRPMLPVAPFESFPGPLLPPGYLPPHPGQYPHTDLIRRMLELRQLPPLPQPYNRSPNGSPGPSGMSTGRANTHSTAGAHRHAPYDQRRSPKTESGRAMTTPIDRRSPAVPPGYMQPPSFPYMRPPARKEPLTERDPGLRHHSPRPKSSSIGGYPAEHAPPEFLPRGGPSQYGPPSSYTDSYRGPSETMTPPISARSSKPPSLTRVSPSQTTLPPSVTRPRPSGLPPTPPLREHGPTPPHPHYPPHFKKGSIIQLASGDLKRVEDLQTEDFVNSADNSPDLKIDSSQVVRVDENAARGTAILGFAVGEQRIQVS